MSCVFAKSVLRKRRSEVYRIRLFRIDAIFLDCLGNGFLVQHSIIRKRLERGYGYVAPVDLEVITPTCEFEGLHGTYIRSPVGNHPPLSSRIDTFI